MSSSSERSSTRRTTRRRRPVQLAQLSEQLNYDLVTFQDHPYQPAFLDTWTLLTWVAAQTSRIRVSGNVLNVPLRQPAVLARAAASLDLLSGGRFDLALGAGGFWDAIEAMGGRRLEPGQAVQALEEAIDIIRGVWDSDNRTPLRVDGEFHHVHGAKRGPAPAHDIPIWIGAYKPRMQRLVGRKADGWLPSLGYLKPGALTAGNAVIDEAAGAAGREPRDIRRILNVMGQFGSRTSGPLKGPVEHWLEVLLPLAVEDGIGTFILGSDDPRTLQTFAAGGHPGTARGGVGASAAPGAIAGASSRSVAVRGKRRSGIDYDALPASSRGRRRRARRRAVFAGAVDLSARRFARSGAAGRIDRPRSSTRWRSPGPRTCRWPSAAAGHGISGRSTNDGGIVIDLSRMNTIEVTDKETRRVRIEAGCALDGRRRGARAVRLGAQLRATTAGSGSAGWPPPAASAGWPASTA